MNHNIINHGMKLLIITIFMICELSGCINRNIAPPQDQNQAHNVEDKTSQDQTNKKVMLDAPIVSQMPELKNGCEVTSLAMLLKYAGVDVDKMTLAEKIKKDKTPLVVDDEGKIIKWGNPNDGFVGDITGKQAGLAVYPGPILDLLEQYLPGRSVNLTDHPFEDLLVSIEQGRPVIVWVTIDLKSPSKYYEWEKGNTKVKATMDGHAVLFVGYDQDYCYINNPYNGQKNEKVKRQNFIDIWNLMGSMAVSYK